MADAVWFGFNPPFIGGQQGVMSRQVDDRLIKNDLVQLLLTLPGERMYRPSFGTRLRAMVFETVSDDDLATLSSEIKAAIQAYEDRVAVTDVSCTTSDEGRTVRVRVDASLTNDPLTKFFVELTFNQGGSVTLTR